MRLLPRTATGAALGACVVLVGCTGTEQRPVPVPPSAPAPSAAVSTTTPTAVASSASPSAAAPGPGVLIRIDEQHRNPPDVSPPPPGQALDAYAPEVRDRVRGIFAAHSVAIEAVTAMPSGYVLVITRRGTDPAAVQKVVADLRAYAPVLDATVEAS